MLHKVEFFYDEDIPNPMKYWVQAMERGIVHVDAVNKFGDTFGIVGVCERVFAWEQKYWLRYWALKPSPAKFWTLLLTRECYHSDALPRIIDIPSLWEDLFFIYNLVAVNARRLSWLLPELDRELDRRVCASLRFAWIAAVAR
jgi:hypothetical protein